jgi:serine/threonine protein kinase
MVNPDVLVGRQVGRYAVLRHLASGGMAELYIARQQAVGGFEKPVVLKILQPRYAQNPRVYAMFLDEARLAAKLNHAAIVHVYDVVDEGGVKYIAMEYIHGETVADIVKRGLQIDRYLPMEHAIHIVSQAAAGLAYAHDRRETGSRIIRIVHRDVSPTNILVSYEGQTKIVDFGIARVQDELRDESGIRPGKASYMSPEQVRGEGADYRSDIFALGIILYELTLCQRLYRGPAKEVMRRILEETIAPPTAVRRDYPTALEQIVMRALEKRPEDRYQSAEELRHDLEEFLDDSGLRSGNRRMSLYMNELFKPDEASSAPSAASADGDELDFDRRAPLSMRIEPAAEGAPARPVSAARLATSSGAGAPRPGPASAPAPSSAPAASSVVAPSPGGLAASADAGPAALPAESHPQRSWIVIVAAIVIGIGTMVFLTLR